MNEQLENSLPSNSNVLRIILEYTSLPYSKNTIILPPAMGK